MTVRAVPESVLAVHQLLSERLVPLLRRQRACSAPTLTRCVNCTGEFTFLANWPDRATLEAFEASGSYQELLDALGPHLRVSPKRELWEVIAAQDADDVANAD